MPLLNCIEFAGIKGSLINILGTDTFFREFATHGFLQLIVGLGTASKFQKNGIHWFSAVRINLGTGDRISKKDIHSNE